MQSNSNQNVNWLQSTHEREKNRENFVQWIHVICIRIVDFSFISIRLTWKKEQKNQAKNGFKNKHNMNLKMECLKRLWF